MILGFTLLFYEPYDTMIPFCVAVTLKTYNAHFLINLLDNFNLKINGTKPKNCESKQKCYHPPSKHLIKINKKAIMTQSMDDVLVFTVDYEQETGSWV